MRIGKARPLEIRHRVRFAPDDIVQYPIARILHRSAHAENIVITADYPQRTIGLQYPPCFGKPFAGELVVNRKAVEFVPIVIDRIDLAIVWPQQITAELQVIGRIGKHHIDAGVG